LARFSFIGETDFRGQVCDLPKSSLIPVFLSHFSELLHSSPLPSFFRTGDACIAEATALAALGNFAFVAQNLRFTQNNCNGIESYCLYFVLSVYDYFMATNDTSLIRELAPAVVPKLEHAKSVWG
jgi:hypothetical protein